jgi:hypothetical protein
LSFSIRWLSASHRPEEPRIESAKIQWNRETVDVKPFLTLLHCKSYSAKLNSTLKNMKPIFFGERVQDRDSGSSLRILPKAFLKPQQLPQSLQQFPYHLLPLLFS